MQKILEDIELDLKELKYLVEIAPRDSNLVPIAKRRIREVIGRLEIMQHELENASVEKENKVVSKEMPAIVEQRSEELTGVESAVILAECLKPAGDLMKCFTLNDTFRFSRELFGGETEEMNKVLQTIGSMHSMPDVMTYLASRFEWDEEDETVNEFIELLRKYFV